MEAGTDPKERPADNTPQNKAPAFIADVFYVGKLDCVFKYFFGTFEITYFFGLHT